MFLKQFSSSSSSWGTRSQYLQVCWTCIHTHSQCWQVSSTHSPDEFPGVWEHSELTSSLLSALHSPTSLLFYYQQQSHSGNPKSCYMIFSVLLSVSLCGNSWQVPNLFCTNCFKRRLMFFNLSLNWTLYLAGEDCLSKVFDLPCSYPAWRIRLMLHITK